MKTPLQELIEWVDTELKLEGDEHLSIIDKAAGLIEKEKKAIAEAWEDAYNNAIVYGTGDTNNSTGEKYYNKTFNHES